MPVALLCPGKFETDHAGRSLVHTLKVLKWQDALLLSHSG